MKSRGGLRGIAEVPLHDDRCLDRELADLSVWNVIPTFVEDAAGRPGPGRIGVPTVDAHTAGFVRRAKWIAGTPGISVIPKPLNKSWILNCSRKTLAAFSRTP